MKVAAPRKVAAPPNTKLLSRKDSSDPFAESFSFTQGEFANLKQARPDLFDPETHPRDRAKLWKVFATTSIGRHFRTT